MAKAPYVPMHPGWWPDIAASITGEWPESAVWMDLRWWRDQEQQGRTNHRGRLIKRPGRYALVKRWGGGRWTHHQVAAVLKAESLWADPYKDDRQATVKVSSDDRQATVKVSSGIVPQVVVPARTAVSGASDDRQATVKVSSDDRPTRVFPPSTVPPSTVHPHPPTPLSGGMSAEREQGQQRRAPAQPNFEDKAPAPASQPQPAPEQLADRDAFVERWNLYAEEFYPGQPSQRWEATTLAGRRGHRNSGFFASPLDEAKEQAMLEFGPHLLPMLNRYAECCRGDHGEEARRPFERGDFEGRRMLAALHLWVTAGKAPHWVGQQSSKVAQPRSAAPDDAGLDNTFLAGWRS